MGNITVSVKFDTKGEGSPLNTHMRYSNRQFCDSGNTLGRLIAPSLSQRPMLLTQWPGKRMLAYQDSVQKTSHSRCVLKSIRLPSHSAEDSSKSRYLRVTKSKLMIRITHMRIQRWALTFCVKFNRHRNITINSKTILRIEYNSESPLTVNGKYYGVC